MRKLRFALAYGEFGENQAFLRVRSSMLALSPWCIGGGKAAREIAKQFTLELTVSTPEASSVQSVAKQPPELSRRSRYEGVGLRGCRISTLSMVYRRASERRLR